MPHHLAHELTTHAAWRHALRAQLDAFAAWLADADLLAEAGTAAAAALCRRLAAHELVLACVGDAVQAKAELLDALFFGAAGRSMLAGALAHARHCAIELRADPGRPQELALLPIQTRLDERTLAAWRAQPDAWERLGLDFAHPAGAAEALRLVGQTRRVDRATATRLGFARADAPPPDADALAEVPAWRHAVINVVHPWLRQGLVVVDAPALDAAGVEPELTLGLLAGAHAVVLVLDAASAAEPATRQPWMAQLPAEAAERFVVLNLADGAAASPAAVAEPDGAAAAGAARAPAAAHASDATPVAQASASCAAHAPAAAHATDTTPAAQAAAADAAPAPAVARATGAVAAAQAGATQRAAPPAHCERIAAQLQLPRARVFAVSLRAATAARRSGDAVALARSGLPALEAALVTQLLPRRRSALVQATNAVIDALAAEAGRRLAQRRREAAEQLGELRDLRGRSHARLQALQQRLEAEVAEFDGCQARLAAVRAVLRRQLLQLHAHLDSAQVQREAARLSAAIAASPLALGAAPAFGELCGQLRAALTAAGAQADEAAQMLAASFVQLNAQYGFAFTPVGAPAIARCVDELDRIEHAYRRYVGPTQAWRLAGATFGGQFQRMLAAKLRGVFETAASEVELWGRAVVAQLEQQLQARRRAFAQRRDALERVRSASGGLEQRIAEVDAQAHWLIGLQRELDALGRQLRAQAAAPAVEPATGLNAARAAVNAASAADAANAADAAHAAAAANAAAAASAADATDTANAANAADAPDTADGADAADTADTIDAAVTASPTIAAAAAARPAVALHGTAG